MLNTFAGRVYTWSDSHISSFKIHVNVGVPEYEYDDPPSPAPISKSKDGARLVGARAVKKFSSEAPFLVALNTMG